MQDISPPNDIPFQNIPEGSSSTRYVEKLILFLEEYLPDFPQESNVKGSQNENELTSKLWAYLTKKCKFNPENKEYPFDFQPEFPQKKPNQKGHGSRVDMASWYRSVKDQSLKVVYCLEAKKLPTPGSEREREYVIGKKGGIERFKNESHGLDDAGNLLENNGIVAYVTEDSFDHWLNQVNQWISDAGCLDSEKLTADYWYPIGKLSSKHQRVSGSDLYLNHFWVMV